MTPLQVPSFVSLINDPSYFKFCFVRNPFERLLSCYLEKVKDGGLTARFQSKLGYGRALVSFSDFIAVIKQESIDDMDPHYAPQYHHNFHQLMNYNYIGRFERLEPDLIAIGSKLKIDFMNYFIRIDPHGTGEKSPKYFFTDSIIDDIVRIYQIDFETFGYSKVPVGWADFVH